MSVELDEFRFRVLNEMVSVKSIQTVWPHFKAEIEAYLGATPTGAQILSIGDHLSAVFLSPPRNAAQKAAAAAIVAAGQTGDEVDEETELAASGAGAASSSSGSRSQGDVSSGGTAWECLVVWYLNLVSYGTDILAVRRKISNTPQSIRDAICVMMNNTPTTTESDVVVYTTPGTAGIGHSLRIEDLDNLISLNTRNASVGIIQCKTNWNDNSQIPMLWDLLYQTRVSPAVNVRLGTNGKNPQSFAGSAIPYAFMTVPTNRRTQHTYNSVSVVRVRNLSGGNYWGQPAKANVADGFSQYLNRNFSAFFSGSLQNHIDRQLQQNPKLLQQFLDLDFDVTGFGLAKPPKKTRP